MAEHLILATVLAAVALLASSAAGQDYPRLACHYTAGNFTPSSRYLANIDIIGAALPKNASASPDLFATVVAGAVPDKVWALALCRGDANATYCLGCLVQASRDLPNSCAYNRDAAIYYDKCMFGYSSTGFPAAVDESGTTYESPNYEDITLEESPRFNRFRTLLMNATADYAAYNSTRRYAAGEADMDLPDYPMLYSWAQCTPTLDLTPARCRRCLAGAISRLYTNSSVGMVLGVRCSIRYQTDPFMDGPVMVRQAAAHSPNSDAPAPTPSSGALAPAPAPAAAGGAGRKYSVPGLVLIAVLPILAAMNLITLLCFWRRSPPTKTKQSGPDYNNEAEDMEIVDSMLMDISTLRAATGDFAESNKLGEGEFGAVYKGVLPDGDEIAVKRMSKSSSQGVDELTNELAVVAKLKHKNLVSLVGVCLEQQERLLVFEFVPNRSLDLVIFDTEKRKRLDWGKRYNIIDGIARGLQYLHEDSQLKVVHRDLKASNILLDSNMSPKISDFGLARIFSREQTHAVTNHLVGTYGYMAPEYRMRGHYSVKSDAFSFGVLVLEIVTGRSNKYCSDSQRSEDLLTWMWEHWMAGTVLEMVDPALNGCFLEDEVRRCIHIGLLCVQENPGNRPVMSSVVMTLDGDTVSLQAPAKPASFASNGGAKPGTASV